MANELDKSAQKAADKEKKAKQAAAMKAAAAKKPKKSPVRYFKEVRSEFKKVSWPSKKQVFNNTVVVLATIVTSGIAIWAIDSLFMFVWKTMLSMQ